MVRLGRLPSPDTQSGYPELAPDLVVEIVSPREWWATVSNKVDSYLAAGVIQVVEADVRAVRVSSSERAERRLRADHDDLLGAEPVLAGFALSLGPFSALRLTSSASSPVSR